MWAHWVVIHLSILNLRHKLFLREAILLAHSHWAWNTSTFAPWYIRPHLLVHVPSWIRPLCSLIRWAFRAWLTHFLRLLKFQIQPSFLSFQIIRVRNRMSKLDRSHRKRLFSSNNFPITLLTISVRRKIDSLNWWLWVLLLLRLLNIINFNLNTLI